MKVTGNRRPKVAVTSYDADQYGVHATVWIYNHLGQYQVAGEMHLSSSLLAEMTAEVELAIEDYLQTPLW